MLNDNKDLRFEILYRQELFMLEDLLVRTHRDCPIEGAKLFSHIMESIDNNPFICRDCKCKLKDTLYTHYFDVVRGIKSILDEMEDDCK